VDIGERRQANILVLAPVGRIDNLTSPEFQARLLAAVTTGSTDVVIDFSAVEYISSAGLRALMTASRQKPRERRLAVARLNAVVHEIFTISRFSHLVPVFATVEEASAAWEASVQAEPAAPRASAEAEPAASAAGALLGTRGRCRRRCGPGDTRQDPRSALLRGPRARHPQAIDAFIDEALPFSVRGTFGGNTSCVEIITGIDERIVRPWHRVREFGTLAQGTWSRTQALLQYIPVAPALGPHHGVPVFCSRLHCRQQHSHLRMSRRAERGATYPAIEPVFSG
jgi:anti-anti-sigma factor